MAPYITFFKFCQLLRPITAQDLKSHDLTTKIFFLFFRNRIFSPKETISELFLVLNSIYIFIYFNKLLIHIQYSSLLLNNLLVTCFCI